MPWKGGHWNTTDASSDLKCTEQRDLKPQKENRPEWGLSRGSRSKDPHNTNKIRKIETVDFADWKLFSLHFRKKKKTEDEEEREKEKERRFIIRRRSGFEMGLKVKSLSLTGNGEWESEWVTQTETQRQGQTIRFFLQDKLIIINYY